MHRLLISAYLGLGLLSLVACGDDNNNESHADAFLPTTCGGLKGGDCGADGYCQYSHHTCGAGDDAGVCMPRPTGVCTATMLTCGCDGMMYDSACQANKVGRDTTDDASFCTAH